MLWRDFAVRSAGFPVSGLEVFGRGDESARLREVAARPALPRGGHLAEPGRARERGRQGRRRAPASRAAQRRREEIGRQLLAALLREERHDRLLRPARVGTRSPTPGPPLDLAVRRARARARGASGGMGRPGARRAIDPALAVADRAAAPRTTCARALEAHPTRAGASAASPRSPAWRRAATRVAARRPRRARRDALARARRASSSSSPGATRPATPAAPTAPARSPTSTACATST